MSGCGAARGPICYGGPRSTDTVAGLDGMPWEMTLAHGEEPERVVDALLGRIHAELKRWTGATAQVFVDHPGKTITLESRYPAPKGTMVLTMAITVCVDELTMRDGVRHLSLLPRIVANFLLWKDGVPWTPRGAEEQLGAGLQALQDRLAALTL